MPSNVGKVRKENSWFFMFEKSLSIFKLLEYLNAAVAKSKNWLSEMQVLRQFSLALKTWQGEEFSKVITINDTWSSSSGKITLMFEQIKQNSNKEPPDQKENLSENFEIF